MTKQKESQPRGMLPTYVKFTIFDQNKRKFNQEGIYLGAEQIERFYEYENFWVDFDSHG